MKEVYNNYIEGKIKYERWQLIGIFCLVVSISGLFGWIYEFIFYFFNGGMKEFYMQGGNFLPWINIYAIGALLIIGLTYHFRKKPLIVFLISFFSTGILEYISGLLVYVIGNGTRYWNYNVEILNFGNIDGFVCFRSVFFFGLSGLLLMYGILPFCIYLSKKINKKTFLILSISIMSLVLFDEFYNLIITKIFNLPSAGEFYKTIGFKYVE